ncbi:hypothetical protein ASD11_11720 [Aeromicrobium sp. Root495]|uniref:DUF4190 domain-containing protein n=1 Tax=Aeromicrobium sp. Root495 TaxID=1736550 RepID=UPI0007000E4C|nr:DUF4190 domain-containing protein [Aeromicrobium sp. Root495]KQY60147.1 hypothetical protein ASD11_11720 [Aeromicrobium sp. Root495]
MPEYPTYPGTGPEQPEDANGPTPPPPPPPPGAWPPPQPAFQPPPGVQPPPGAYPTDGHAPSSYGYVPPKHPNATTAMVLGIVGIAGGFLCVLPILVAPFAWFMGSRAIRDIDASAGGQSGRSEAMAGKVLGIIGTALLVLGVALIAFFIIMAFADPSFYDDEY